MQQGDAMKGYPIDGYNPILADIEARLKAREVSDLHKHCYLLVEAVAPCAAAATTGCCCVILLLQAPQAAVRRMDNVGHKTTIRPLPLFAQQPTAAFNSISSSPVTHRGASSKSTKDPSGLEQSIGIAEALLAKRLHKHHAHQAPPNHSTPYQGPSNHSSPAPFAQRLSQMPGRGQQPQAPIASFEVPAQNSQRPPGAGRSPPLGNVCTSPACIPVRCHTYAVLSVSMLVSTTSLCLLTMWNHNHLPAGLVCEPVPLLL